MSVLRCFFFCLLLAVPLGQVVTLRFPPEKLREVNLAIEHGAWGGFHTEFYATYDYKPMWQESRQNNRP